MVAKDYFLASVRLASFRPQRRSSVAGGGGKATKWPHKNMAPKRVGLPPLLGVTRA